MGTTALAAAVALPRYGDPNFPHGIFIFFYLFNISLNNLPDSKTVSSTFSPSRKKKRSNKVMVILRRVKHKMWHQFMYLNDRNKHDSVSSQIHLFLILIFFVFSLYEYAHLVGGLMLRHLSGTLSCAKLGHQTHSLFQIISIILSL